MARLKVIALISGGKDSFFSILHCQANGHEVVALANLYPPLASLGKDEEDEDIDSFMYQTVGHSVIPLYAEALGLTLYRQEISGTSGMGERDYAPAIATTHDGKEQDETESLIPLLEKVMKAHPEANAISTGAILSTYQRTRIESVALRLSLTPLSYLWQYPFLPPYTQTSLLEDMRTIGQDSRIVKVASGALDESFLWKNVADEVVVKSMVKNMERFGGAEGGAVLGEGGEFETLAIDGPEPLWKGRIEVGAVEKVKGEGGSAVVRLKDAKVIEKEKNRSQNGDFLRLPELLDTEFAVLLQDLETLILDEELQILSVTEGDDPPSSEGHATFQQFSSSNNLANLFKPIFSTISHSSHCLSRNVKGPIPIFSIPNILDSVAGPEAQMKRIMHVLGRYLSQLGLTEASIISTTLLLRSMSTFASINAIYGSNFTTPNPPSRVTVSCGNLLPSDVDVVLSVIVDERECNVRQRKDRDGLHVQSRSYWAPANIGPYSQAISITLPTRLHPHMSKEVDERNDDNEQCSEGDPEQARIVHIAGQIPLVPASMQLVKPDLVSWSTKARAYDSFLTHSKTRDFIVQTTLSLQHLVRIGRATDVHWWTGAVAYISTCSMEESKTRALIVMQAWKRIHQQAFASHKQVDEDETDEDEEHVDVWDLRNRRFGFQTQTTTPEQAKKKDTRSLLPDYSRLKFTPTTIMENAKPAPKPPVFIVEVSELPRAADIEWFSTGLSLPSFSSNSPQSQVSLQFPNMPTGIAHSVSVGNGRQFTHQGIKDIESWIDTGEYEGRAICTIYTTKILPDWVAEKWRPMVVPCFRIWEEYGEGVGEVEAVFVHSTY